MSEFLLSLAENETALKMLLIVALVMIVAGIILRFVCHAIVDMPRAASACLAMIFIYVLAVCTMGYEAQSSLFMNALPFIGDGVDYHSIYATMKTDFDRFFIEVAKLFVMAFFINLAQDLFIRRRKRNFFIWWLLQSVVIVGALLVNYGVDYLLRTYLPDGFADWLPVVIFCVIGLLLLLTLVKLIFNLLNPLLALVLGFFSGNLVGRTLTKAFLSTALLTAVVVVTDWLGYGQVLYQLTLGIDVVVPVVLLLIFVWYLVWRILC